MKVNVYFNRWIFKALNNNSKDHVLNSIFYRCKDNEMVSVSYLARNNIPYYFLFKDKDRIIIGNNFLEMLHFLNKDITLIKRAYSLRKPFYNYIEELYGINIACFYIKKEEVEEIVKSGKLVDENLIFDCLVDGTVKNCPSWLLKYFGFDPVLEEYDDIPFPDEDSDNKAGTISLVAKVENEDTIEFNDNNKQTDLLKIKVEKLIQLLKAETTQLESLTTGIYTNDFIKLKLENICKEINMVFYEN